MSENMNKEANKHSATLIASLLTWLLLLAPTALAQDAGDEDQSNEEPSAQAETNNAAEVAGESVARAPLPHLLAGLDMSAVRCRAPRVVNPVATDGDGFHPLAGVDMTRLRCAAPMLGQVQKASVPFRPVAGITLDQVRCSAPLAESKADAGSHPLAAADMSKVRCWVLTD